MADFPDQHWRAVLEMAHFVFSTVYNELSVVGNHPIIEHVRNYERNRKMFTWQEMEMLENNQIGDVTMIYKLLPIVCNLAPHESSAWITPDSLEYFLRAIRNERTKLIHSVEHSPENIGDICSNLEELFDSVLTKLEMTGRDVSHARQFVTSQLTSRFVTDWDIYMIAILKLWSISIQMVFKHYNRYELGVKEFLSQNIGINQIKFKRIFTTYQRREIETCKSLSELDPAILYIILDIGGLIPKEAALYDMLKRLRSKRNEAVHMGVLNDHETEACAYQLFSNIHGILQELGTVGGQIFFDLLSQMGKGLFPVCAPVFSGASLVVPPPASTEVPSSSTVPTPSSTVLPTSVAPPLSSDIGSFSSHVPSTLPPLPSATIPSSSALPSSTAGSASSSIPFSSTASQLPTVLGSAQYTQEDMNLVRVFKCLCRGSPAVKAFAKTFEKLFPDGLSQVLNYCKDTLKYTGKQLKTFTAIEVNHIQNNTELTDLDLTFLYKCLGHVCGLGKQEHWQNEPDTIGYYLYLVKMKRNFLFHEAVCCTNNDLARMAVELPQFLVAILHKVGEKCNEDMSTTIDEVRKELKSLFGGILPVEDVRDYHQRILDMCKQLATRTLALARKEIKEHYNCDRFRVVNPITWYFDTSHTRWDINEVYTDLHIIDSTGSNSAGGIVSYKILTLIRSSLKILVVEGVGGAGKTSLCKFVIQSWSKMCNKMDGLVEVDLIIFIQCRHICSGSEKLVTFLTEDLLKETFCDVAHEDVILSLRDARLLFIVDGFDEAGPAARNLVHEAFVKFPSSAFIITTRPEFRNNVDLMIYDATGSRSRTLLCIHGFKNTMRIEYIKKMFDKLNSSPDPFLRHLKVMDKQLGSFTQLPLTLAILVLLWNDNSEMVSEATSITGIYKQIVKFFLKRFVERQQKRKTEARHPKDIERKINQWLKTFTEIAWDLMKENRMFLREPEEDILRNKSDECGIDPTDSLSCLMHCDIKEIATDEVWEFIHKTVQEFLAAEHLSNYITEGNKSVEDALEIPQNTANRQEQVKAYSHIIQFIAGILVEKENLTKTKAQQIFQLFHLQSPWSFDFLKDLSRECNSSTVFTNSLSNMFKHEVLADQLQGYELESLHSVLQQTALSVPLTTRIKVSYTDIGKMKPLLDLLTARGCRSQFLVSGNDPQCVYTAIDTLTTVNQPSAVEIIFEIRNRSIFPILLAQWPRTKPLYIHLPRTVLPILWLEFSACMAAHNVSPKLIKHRAYDNRVDVVRTLAEALGSHYEHYTTGCEGEIVIKYI